MTFAERELMLPSSLTKCLVNHARPNDVTEGYAADWTVSQLRAPAQNVADRIEALFAGSKSVADAADPTPFTPPHSTSSRRTQRPQAARWYTPCPKTFDSKQRKDIHPK